MKNLILTALLIINSILLVNSTGAILSGNDIGGGAPYKDSTPTLSGEGNDIGNGRGNGKA